MSKDKEDYDFRVDGLVLDKHITLILENYKVINDELHELTVGVLQLCVDALVQEYGDIFVNFIPERGAEIWCRTGDTALRIVQWSQVAGVACHGDISMVTWFDQARSALLISISNMNQNIGKALSSENPLNSTFIKDMLSNYSGIAKGQRMHKWFMEQFNAKAVSYKAKVKKKTKK